MNSCLAHTFSMFHKNVLPSEYPHNTFRNSRRFRPRTSQYSQFDYDDDESSDEESDGHFNDYGRLNASRRDPSGRTSSQLKLLFILVLFTSTFLIVRLVRDGTPLYFELAKKGLGRAGHGVRNQVFSSCRYIQRFAHSSCLCNHDHPSDPGVAIPAAVPVNNWDTFSTVTVISSSFAQIEAPVRSSHEAPDVSGDSSKLQDSSSIIRDLNERIDAAIIRRSAHSPTLRDFALNADYIHDLTSYAGSTLDLQHQRGFWILSRITGFDVGRGLGNTPITALRDGGNDEQSCWAFEGSSGYLGIRLQARISVESITLEHLPRDLLPDLAILKAPRKVVLWGLVEGPHNLSKERQYREYIAEGPMSRIMAQSSFISRTKEAERYVPLVAFEYKLSGQPLSHIQQTKVPQAIQSLQMDFQTVVLEIISNWGATSTCLYRIQVHGSPLKAVGLPAPYLYRQ